MYGLTECKRVSYLPPDQLDARPTSVGVPIPGTEAWIVDEHGDEVGPGEVGELVVRGGHVMQGYWNDPEATAERLRPGRWPWERVLATGDLFRRDEEGYLFFVGRRDDIIKSRGEKVAPREVEEVLARRRASATSPSSGSPTACSARPSTRTSRPPTARSSIRRRCAATAPSASRSTWSPSASSCTRRCRRAQRQDRQARARGRGTLMADSTRRRRPRRRRRPCARHTLTLVALLVVVGCGAEERSNATAASGTSARG